MGFDGRLSNDDIQKFKEEYNNYRKIIEENLEKTLRSEFPSGLYDPMKYALSSGGKMLRPVMVLLSCESVGSDFKKALRRI